MIDPATRAAYAHWQAVTLRYGDTDRQGHVNNAVFSTLFEAGRVGLIYDEKTPLTAPGTAFVIARIVIDFKAELNWPGEALVGTRVARVGRSSMTFEQAIYKDGRLVATSENVVVLMDEASRRSTPLSDEAVARLQALGAGAA